MIPDIGLADEAFEVTPDDDTDLAPHRSLWVGGAGDLVVLTRSGRTVTFATDAGGCIVPVRARRVLQASTATSIVALV